MGGDRAGGAAAVIGFCLAAGAGSRLMPLTRVTPKPLLAPAGRPLVDLAVEALQAAGATRVVVNAHHGAEQLMAPLAGRSGVEVVVEPVLLGTGGGLVNAAKLGLLGDGDDPVLVTAADHVVDPADLAALAAFLDQSGAPMAAGLVPAAADPFGLRLEDPPADQDRSGHDVGLGTMADPTPPAGLRSPPGGPPGGGSGSSLPRSSGTGWADSLFPGGPGVGGSGSNPVGSSGAVEWWGSGQDGGPTGPLGGGPDPGGGRVVRDPDGPWDSAGVYALRVGVLVDLEPGPATLVGRVLGPLLDRGDLAGLPFRGPMADGGTLARLLDVSAGLLSGRWPYALPPGRVRRGIGTGPAFVAEGARVDPTAVLAGPVVLDAGCRVGAGAVVTRAVVGPGAVVGSGARVVGSFLGPGVRVPPGVTVTAALVPGVYVPPAPRHRRLRPRRPARRPCELRECRDPRDPLPHPPGPVPGPPWESVVRSPGEEDPVVHSPGTAIPGQPGP